MDNKNRLQIQVGSRPLTAGIPNPTCPILLEARLVLDKAQDLHRAISKLRRSTQRCLTCPESAECPTMLNFITAANTALRELSLEWGLDKE
jgi:hypothetical protein